MAWQPILDGELADRAWRAVRAIADALANERAPAADLALFWSYASAALDDERYARATDEALERFAATFASGLTNCGLHGGVTGLGWIASHVADDAEDMLELVDTSILRWLEGDWQGHYDLIDGLVGFGVYFLERGHAAGRARVLEQLSRIARRDRDGAYWYTPLALLPATQRTLFPDGYTNLGLAHGIPGAIALLARYPADDAPAHELRREAERWLRARDLGAAGYPGMLDRGPPRPSRTAWCYGDPGVAIALWQSALADGRAPDEDLAQRWITRAHTGVRDAPLCHGAAGLAHIANRCFQATRNPIYRDAAIRYVADTLAFEQPGAPLGGYLARAGDAWVAKPDFLDGAAGVALALLAALTPLEPEWDRSMLCDLPTA